MNIIMQYQGRNIKQAWVDKSIGEWIDIPGHTRLDKGEQGRSFQQQQNYSK